MKDRILKILRECSGDGMMTETTEYIADRIVESVTPSVSRHGPDFVNLTDPGLSLDTYQRSAAGTDFTGDVIDKMSIEELRSSLKFAYNVMAMAGEVGEVANKAKKVIRDSAGVITPERGEAMAKELGGALWYMAAVARNLKIRLSAIANWNLAELASRKKRGTLHGDGDNR